MISHRPRIEPGQKFGLLTVKEKVGSKRYNTAVQAIWRCECECGNVCEVLSSSLHTGRTQSCTCLRKKRNALAPGRAARNEVFRKYRTQAQERDFLWEITEGEFDRLTSESCHYCGAPPSNVKRLSSGEFTYSGIDRMDNSRGYEEGNVVPCCIECNRLKGRMSYEKFVAWLNRVANYRAMKPFIGMEMYANGKNS